MASHHHSLFSVKPQKQRKYGSRTDARADLFPCLTGMALSMLIIEPNGLREPHWHPNANELTYCIGGKGLVTIFGNRAAHDTFVIETGDLSFIPQGSIHAIENIGDEPLQLVVCFNHEQPEDFELSTSVSAIPDAILGTTFGLDPNFFAKLNHDKESVFIGQRIATKSIDNLKMTDRLHFALEKIQPQLETHGGWVKKCYSDLFPAIEGLTAYSLLLQSHGVREPHWHPNAHELNYLISGRARISLHLPNETVETFDMQAGDLSFLPKGYPHYIETIGNEEAKFIVFFNNVQPADIGFSGAFGAYSNETLATVLGSSPEQFEQLPKYQEDLLIVPI